VMGSIGTAAKHSVVTIDRGSLQGVQTGQVLSVNQKVKLLLIQKPKNAFSSLDNALVMSWYSKALIT